MLWWESVAPFGKPVVPLVYWMLIGSSNCSSLSRSLSAASSTTVRAGEELVPVVAAEEHDPLE